MNLLVESLRRLYITQKVTKEQIKAFVESQKLTQEEYKYIITEDKKSPLPR